jgi:hypothetical protein
MSKISESMKKWGSNHPKTVRAGKTLGAAILKGLLYSGYEQISATPPPIPGETEVLGAEQIRQLSGMSSFQLESLFEGRKVKFATDAESLEAIKALSTFQIDAILGKE